MYEQAAKRVTESMLGSKAGLAEETAHIPPQADQVITAIRTRTEHRIGCAQFFQSQM